MAYIEKRKNGDGKTSFRVQIRLKGFPHQAATFPRRTDAKQWAQATETAMREGRYFNTVEAKKHTLAEIINRYLEDVLPKKSKSSQINQGKHLKWWHDQIGETCLADVTPAMLAQCRDILAKDHAPATVVRYMAALSHSFTIAVKEWGWLEDSPMRKVSKPKEPRGRVRFLSDEEKERLLEACRESENPYIYLVVVLAISTGARKMEILSLKWEDVDFQRQVITLHDTKNGERRVLPLTGHALELMQEHAKVRHLASRFVFPSRNGKKPFDVRRAWEAARLKANITNFRFHDLRHSAASYLAMDGASLVELSTILGHKSLSMVKKYSHLSEDHTAGVVARMNEKVFGKSS